MKDINEQYVIKKYQENNSTYSIAEELKTYPKKIERILKKHGLKLRSKSESQSLALKSGRCNHPTRGKKRTEEEKLKISEATHKSWKKKSKKEKEDFSNGAKERWKNLSAFQKREMQEKAGRALRKSADEGSKAEKSLYNKLIKNGYEVVLHKKDLIEGDYEIDLFLPEFSTIIEIDGPQHFIPIFGEERLQDVIRADTVKNGLLISRGFCILRIKYLCKNFSQKTERMLWELIEPELEKIKNSFPPKEHRFIELEISNV